MRKIESIIDKNHKWGHISEQQILYMIGEIPLFIMEGKSDKWTDRIDEFYPYATWSDCNTMPVIMNKDRSNDFEGDPTQHPIFSMIDEQKEMHIYTHSMVYITNDGGKNWHFGRID